MLKIFLLFLPLILISGCTSSKPFDFSPGFYEAGHPREDALSKALDQSSIMVKLSGHAGISLSAKNGKGWDDKISIEKLKKQLDTIPDRQQATILEEKNFTGQEQLDEKVVVFLKEAGFKIVIIQVCHSQGILIEAVIRN